MKTTQQKINIIQAIKEAGIDLRKDYFAQSANNIATVKELAKGLKFSMSKTSYYGRAGQVYNHLQRIAIKENLI